MSRHLVTPIFLACAAFAGAGDVKSFAATFYSKVDHALVKKDVATYAKLYRGMTTPDYTETDAKGVKRTLADSIKMVKQVIAEVSRISVSDTKIVSVQKAGALSHVSLSNHVVAILKGADGKTHKLDSRSTEVDTWKMFGKSWKLAYSKELAEKALLDGKPFSG